MSNQNIQKFNLLPKANRDFLSSSEILSAIEKLEKKYNIELAMLFIELVVGEFLLINLNNRFPMLDSSGIMELKNKLSELISIYQTKFSQQRSESSSPVTFSPEDDEEIKQILSSGSSNSMSRDYPTLAEGIIAESDYSIDGDEVIFTRLKNIIIARLKDIRDVMETLEALKKSRKIGGLDMSDEQANKIMALIDEKINQGLIVSIEEKQGLNNSIDFPSKKPFIREKTTLEAIKNNAWSTSPVSEEKKVEVQKVERPKNIVMPEIIEEDGLPVIKYPQGDELMVKPRVIGFKGDKKNQLSNLEIPHKAVSESEIRAMPIIKSTEIAEPVVTPEPRPMIKSTPSPRNIRFGKPVVDGVRVGGMLVGPIEELGTMTLINFRRLGETPHSSIAKVKEKVKLLEKDSYAKMLEGIDAWHQSEVNRFYRLLGQESMRQERSIDDIINERLMANKPTLSIEEFNSVMELNKDLRY